MASIQELLIKIGLKADTTGATQAAGALDKIGKSADTAAAANKDLAKGIGAQVEVSGAAVSMFQNLEKASQGGAQGLLGAANAVRNFGTMLKTTLAGAGPIGIAVTAIAALSGVILALKDAFKPAGESAEEMAKKIDAANKAKLDGVKAQLDGVTKSADEARKRIDSVNTAINTVADARLGANLAEIDNSKLSPAEKDAAKRRLTQQREDEKRAASVAAEQAKVELAAQESDAKIAIAKQKTAEAATAAGNLSKLKAAQQEYDTASGAVAARAFLGESSGAGGPSADMVRRAVDAQTALDAAKRAAGAAPEKTAETAMEAAKQAMAEANKAADSFRTVYEGFKVNVAANQAVGFETIRQRAAQEGRPLPVSRPTSGGVMVGPDGVVRQVGAGLSQGPGSVPGTGSQLESGAEKAGQTIASAMESAKTAFPSLDEAAKRTQEFQQAQATANLTSVVQDQAKRQEEMRQRLNELSRQIVNIRK